MVNSSLPKPFPPIEVHEVHEVHDDYNPAIRLFGHRFVNQQTVVEYLAEFLALVTSQKWLDEGEIFDTPLPSLAELKEWPGATSKLKYKLPVKLNLKLFAFLGVSRFDSRDKVHKKHYEKLIEKLEGRIRISSGNVQEAIERLEELLCSFQGAGFNRAWCAKTFFPISSSLLTRETIWNISKAKKYNPESWEKSIEEFKKYYSVAKHRFMARGGELLYLQLCNFFATEETKIKDFPRHLNFADEETDRQKLYQSLQGNLQKLRGEYTTAFDRLVDYIELLDEETSDGTNKETDQLTCEWCPQESWPEGYLFAVEINRLLSAVLDPVERLELLKTGCALQVLRSLCAQSIRYADILPVAKDKSVLGYAWIFSSPVAPLRQQRLVSQRNLQVIQGLIQKALRHDELMKNAAKAEPRITKDRLYNEADKKYGHKLFLSLGKNLGIIVPFRGPGARFVMTDSILRYMVLVLLRPGERCSYDDFLRRLYLHYGIAVEERELTDAAVWSGFPGSSSIQPLKDSWLTGMLRAGGFLTELSDACSIVHNTFKLNKLGEEETDELLG
ncbi:hypothetical protein LR013_03705 [candidate division NPL-UPA2 bacterium]|nr:hypothetical protein [candidate division NPL-UPA2 bacterium]